MSVGTVDRPRDGQPRDRGLFQGRGIDFLPSQADPDFCEVHLASYAGSTDAP
jgi:hypothetical protein